MLPEIMLEFFFEHNPVPMFVYDKDTLSFSMVNNAAAQYYGYAKEEFLTKTLNDIRASKTIHSFHDNLERAKNNFANSIRERHTKKDGTPLYVEMILCPLPGHNIMFPVLALSVDRTEEIRLQELIAHGDKEYAKMKEDFQLFFEDNLTGNYISSPAGQLIDCNLTFLKIFGFASIEEAKSSNVYNLYANPDDREKFLTALREHKKLENFETTVRSKAGFPLHITESVRGIFDKEGVLTELRGFCIDNTERKRIEHKLESAKEKAEEINKLKSNLLAKMSHELRTPMIGILGYSEILKEELEDPGHREMSEFIHSSSTRLMQTLNALLELSLIESSDQEIFLKDVNIVSVVERTVKPFAGFAERENLYLQTEISHREILSNLDERLLEQILKNLLNNAVKFTKLGGVTVKVDSETRDGSEWATIKVIDTGIGIPQGNLDSIFEEFHQVSEGLSRTYEGSGLGLTLTKKYIELMKGTVSVESTLGNGSIFTIRFPTSAHYSAAPGNKVDESEPPKSKSTSTSYRILVVDDDKTTRKFILLLLRKRYKLDIAEDGQSAIDLASRNAYSLILMDISFDFGMNGIEAVKEIRKIKGYRNIPIVALTAYAMRGDKELFLSQGFSHYLSKPFESKDFLRFIRGIFADA